MPKLHDAPYLPTGDPAVMNVPLSSAQAGSFTNYDSGSIGRVFEFQGRDWMKVLVESGATQLSAGMLLFWKDRAAGTVTNVVANAVSGGTANAWRNQVAGFYLGSTFTPGTSGNVICLLRFGRGVSVLCSAGAIGVLLVADVAANVGQTLGIAVGTAPTFVVLGTVTVAAAGSPSKATADINLTGAP